jgi:hypothetical protein
MAKSSAGTTVVTLERSGYNGGDIHLVESSPFLAATHHLDFSADFQSYEYDKVEHGLVIEGQSPKMGKYRISILPKGPVPSN